MVEAAERTGTSATADDTPAHLPDDIVAEILVPLPARSVIRCGAVCKAWRRITTDPHFRARRRLPASILVYTHQPAAALPGSDLPATGGNGAIDVAVDALPVSSDEAGRRRLIRYPRLSHADPAHCHLLASCNGVLLFKQGQGSYLLCNPVTRQWAELPRLPNEYCNGRNGEYAFYFHRPSGEFRLLCCLNGLISTWYIISTGGGGPRRVTQNAMTKVATRLICCSPENTSPPVLLHGNMHWPPWQCVATDKMWMVAFDTVSETFHPMAGPTRTRTISSCATMVKLFDMDERLVAVDLWGEEHVDLWFLEDYSARRWENRHRIRSPWKNHSIWPWHSWVFVPVAGAGDDEGNVILGDHHKLVVYDTRRRRMVRIIDSVVNSLGIPVTTVSRHVFRGTREQHTCFNTPSSASLKFLHSFSD